MATATNGWWTKYLNDGLIANVELFFILSPTSGKPIQEYNNAAVTYLYGVRDMYESPLQECTKTKYEYRLDWSNCYQTKPISRGRTVMLSFSLCSQVARVNGWASERHSRSTAAPVHISRVASRCVAARIDRRPRTHPPDTARYAPHYALRYHTACNDV